MRYAAEELDLANAAEIEALVQRYYACTPAHTGLPEYDFNWQAYLAAQGAGQLAMLTAREDNGTLCGVALYLLMEHPHHRGWVGAECDTLSVDHTKRGEGIGRNLVQAAEGMLKARGVNFMLHRYRTCYQTEPLFPKLGFAHTEQVFMKEI